jgi:hypothetical protein
MKTQQPTPQDIDELVSYLPRLYADGFTPIAKWEGGDKDQDGVITLSWPVYEDVVKEFYQVAAMECWCDYGYDPAEAGEMLRSEVAVSDADMDQIKTMLTFCVRGERFCDGHWGAMIEEGHLRRLLQRLTVLQKGMRR